MNHHRTTTGTAKSLRRTIGVRLMMLLLGCSFLGRPHGSVKAFRVAAIPRGANTARFQGVSTPFTTKSGTGTEICCLQRQPLLRSTAFRTNGISKWGLAARLGHTLGGAPRGSLSSSSRLFASYNKNSNDDDDDGWQVPSTIHIPEESLDLSFVRSSGAGGQNVNKLNTQVQIKVLIDAMGWIPYEVRERLRIQQSNRINKEGFLVLQVQEYRTQSQNRKAALQKLQEMILQAWPRPKTRNMRTGISEKTKRKRRDDKRKRSLVKENRRRVDF